MFFFSNSKQDGAGVNEVVFQLYNPKYHDLKVIDIALNLSDYDLGNHRWAGQNVSLDVYAFYKESRKSKCICQVMQKRARRTTPST